MCILGVHMWWHEYLGLLHIHSSWFQPGLALAVAGIWICFYLSDSVLFKQNENMFFKKIVNLKHLHRLRNHILLKNSKHIHLWNNLSRKCACILTLSEAENIGTMKPWSHLAHVIILQVCPGKIGDWLKSELELRFSMFIEHSGKKEKKVPVHNFLL